MNNGFITFLLQDIYAFRPETNFVCSGYEADMDCLELPPMKSLEKHKEILEGTPDLQNVSVSAHAHLLIAKMGLETLVDKQKQMLLLVQNHELLEENKMLRELVESKGR